MTDNWNALTDDERTKALAETVLGWEIVSRHCVGHWNTMTKQGPRLKPFSPLTDLRHTALLWAALTNEQQMLVWEKMFYTKLISHTVIVNAIGDVLDPLKLSQAIYAVTAGQEEPTNDN